MYGVLRKKWSGSGVFGYTREKKFKGWFYMKKQVENVE